MVASNVVDAEPCGAGIELFRLGVGRAAEMLTDLVGANVELSIPYARLGSGWIGGGRLVGLQSPEAIVTQAFAGEIQGRAILGFSAAGGLALAQRLSGRHGGDLTELDSELSGILLEVGSIVISAMMGSLANAMAADLYYSLPELQSANRKGEQLVGDVGCTEDNLLGDITVRFAGQEIDGATVAICPVHGARQLLRAFQETNAACMTA